MNRGVHAAQFRLRENGFFFVGVVGPGFDPSGGKCAKDLANSSWTLPKVSGDLRYGNTYHDWPGKQQAKDFKQGEVIVSLHHCLRTGVCQTHKLTWNRA